MKEYKGYLIDLDGTMYRGTESIKEAGPFVEELLKRDIPHLFVTNNSSKTAKQVVEKLTSMGIPAEPSRVFTSSMAASKYVDDTTPDATIYMIGEEGLKEALGSRCTLDASEANVVVMGIDRDITYEKLSDAALAVRRGATFISTNGDKAIPTEKGFVPGNGSLTSVISVSTGVDPIFVGKPEAIIMEQALEILGTKRDQTVMVGDNYDTDIMAGIKARIDTIHVATGVTSQEDLKTKTTQPTHTIPTLKEWF
ncbi:TIGR01457 family HAD-type hydrolase [Paenalkalicoccus suaedae]|uniref:TIGR01457 family HAD-type hydrolase n=1 Tax=Paenalkalicoccus suaedae TaxID=2592382 RepID=A0A859FGF9_9BACI|nr:TIGR01457 family HAD-type hydrolase [Paenalkalicoccus suaedae]QKS72187.1 TIGR01457 family HAD-type hydrolase [Paenalkalicoccus suaedae]